MMKNFTKILLGLLTLATFSTVNAEDNVKMEWRVVSNEDFGGNDPNAPAMRTDEPTDFTTMLNFSPIVNPRAGTYMVVKSTKNALNRIGTPLMTAAGGWNDVSDHTYESDSTIGYFMVFDCDDAKFTGGRLTEDQKQEIIKNGEPLYQKKLAVSCSDIQFKFSAYMRNLNPSATAANQVKLSISSAGSDNVLNEQGGNINDGSAWTRLELLFTSSGTDIVFSVKAIDAFAAGYDLALDDIVIEVQQPEITIDKPTTFKYKEKAVLEAKYDQAAFDKYFGGSYSGVQYQWYKKPIGADDSQYVPLGSPVNYTSGAKITYEIDAFEKDLHNGVYKVSIASSGNLNNDICSVQKTETINVRRDDIYVTLCQDSTKNFQYGTRNLLLGTDPTQSMVSFPGIDADFNMTYESVTTLPDIKTYHECLNAANPTAGTFPLPGDTTYWASGCPKTIQNCQKVVAASIPDDPAHICEGTTYEKNSRLYDTVDETVGDPITFMEGGCTHSQLVFVHPNKSNTIDTTICEGSSVEGVTYSTGGSYTSAPIRNQTQYHCDSVVIYNIKVLTPVVNDLGEKSVCPSDNFVFDDGVVYNTPMRKQLSYTHIGPNGCDSTVKLFLIVEEGGNVTKDTLICRDQFLFGREYPESGEFQATIHGETESGCPRDTIWNIKVVSIQLKLRMAFNQYEVCEKQPASMNNTLICPVDYKMHWDPEIPENILSPTVYLEETKDYTLYVDATIPASEDPLAKGCHAKETVKITVNPVPVLTIDSVDSEERTVEYTIEGGTTPYHMFLGSEKKAGSLDLGEIESSTGTLEKQSFGEHMLIVQDSKGCSSEQPFKIEEIVPEPTMILTPNGDGVNDRWIIKNISVYPNSYVRIYDRFGKLLLESEGSSFEDGWDGTYNGQKMPATDYWYEIDIEEIDKQYFGHFTLMR